MIKRGKIHLSILLGILIVLVIAIGGYVGMQGSSSVVERVYIESMQRQDYEGAFRTIDAQNFLLNGRHTTRTQFIQEAQAVDSQEGRITSVREINVRTDPVNSERTITYIVSREQRSYPVQLLLKISNGTFLTPLFDSYPYRIVSVSQL
jgi:uncharacterized protein (UPF0333 family)